jgi:hypothetical protein
MPVSTSPRYKYTIHNQTRPGEARRGEAYDGTAASMTHYEPNPPNRTEQKRIYTQTAIHVVVPLSTK